MLNPTYSHSAVRISIGITKTSSHGKSSHGTPMPISGRSAGSNGITPASTRFTSPVCFSNISDASIPLNTSPTSCGEKKTSR